MTKALNDIKLAALREAPFFILNGPDGRQLPCQWSCYDNGARGTEFEIIVPENPDAMGCLYGLCINGEFRMRPAIKYINNIWTLVPEMNLDQLWRGSLDDIVDSGYDWEMSDNGRLIIADPEEPAADPQDAIPLRRAA